MRRPVIDPALLDAPCPMCDAVPLELCSVRGREMESTVHAPRRARTDTTLPKTSTQRVDGKCKSGRHDWTEANTYEESGTRKCLQCRRERQRKAAAARRANKESNK